MTQRLTGEQQDALDQLWSLPRRSRPPLVPFRDGSFGPIQSVLKTAPSAPLVPSLAALYWSSGNPSVHGICRELLSHHLPRIPVGDLPRIDEEIRSGLHGYAGSRHRGAPLGPVANVRDDDLVRTWIAACHPSGYIRQKAVGQLARRDDLVSIALLLVRANDWVNPVATPAVAAAEHAMSALAAPRRLLLLPLIDRLGDCHRFRRKNSIITHYLTNEVPWTSWFGAFESGDCDRQRILSRLAESKVRASSSPAPAAVVRALVRCDDPVVMLRALRHLLPGLPGGELEELLPELAASRWPLVRREAVRLLISRNPPDARVRLVGLLTNRSRMMRSFARFHLVESLPEPAPDFRQHYLDQLATAPDRPWALRGLAEVDPECAHREALRRLDAPSVALRKAAIECLKESALPDHLEFLLRMLESPERGLVRSAFIQLRKITHLLSAATLFECARRSAHPQVILQLVRLLSKWERLGGLLLLSTRTELRPQVITSLWNWLRQQNSSWVSAPPGSLIRIRNLLEDNQADLPADLIGEFTFVIQQEAKTAGR